MKLWYQSMSRQTEWGGYPRVLRGILDKVRDPDTAHTAIEARMPGCSNGSFASGSLRFTVGTTTIASSRRTGPRMNGLLIAAPSSRLRPEATFSEPSGSRTAQAHAVGPCTRTPLRRAIPPSRILSSMLSP